MRRLEKSPAARTDWNNFGPRLGLAWDLGRGPRSAPAAASYNRINNTVWSDERLNPPFFANASATVQDGIPILYTLGPNYPPNPALSRGLDENGGIRGARIDLRVIDPETTLPYSYNWFAGVQRQLPWDFVLEANYIGSAGRNFMSADGPGGEDYNRFAGDMFDNFRNRLNPSFGVVGLAESRISSNYHGMTLQVNRRFLRGSVQAAYTLGNARIAGVAEEVTTSVATTATPGSTRQARVQRALADPCEPTNAWLRNTIGGWQLNTITIWQSGQPFTVTCNSRPIRRATSTPMATTGSRQPSELRHRSPDISDGGWPAGSTPRISPRPTGGALGTLPRNPCYGPSYSARLLAFKNISFSMFSGRNQTVQLRVETTTCSTR
jgi:hypothetical protein